LAQSGWTLADYSVELWADGSFPADSAQGGLVVLTAYGSILADYSAQAGPSERRCSLDARLARWLAVELQRD
jgi:hypothetical protein